VKLKETSDAAYGQQTMAVSDVSAPATSDLACLVHGHRHESYIRFCKLCAQAIVLKESDCTRCGAPRDKTLDARWWDAEVRRCHCAHPSYDY